MAHFMGTVKGNRGLASRLGTKNTGLTVRCNGWHCGIEVYALYDATLQKDIFIVYQTGGSANSNGKEIARITEK